MRNRDRQKELKKENKEEKLDIINIFGKFDPTPFQAINNLIAKGKLF